jgi:hypothetical protein
VTTDLFDTGLYRPDIQRETERAYCVLSARTGRTYWLPKSQVQFFTVQACFGDSIFVPRWLGAKNGWFN